MENSTPEGTVSASQESKHHWSTKEIVLWVLALVTTILLCVAGIYFKDYLWDMEYITHYGLLGVLIASFVAGSTVSFMAVPVPYWLFVFTLPPLLAAQWGIASPILVGITSGLGSSLGQLITFMIGYGGRGLSQKLVSRVNGGFYDKAKKWAQKHGSVTVFAMSAIQNPFHLPMTLAIASLHYSRWKFFVFSLLGNIVKSSIIAFLGYFGLTSLFHLLGI